MQLWATHRIQAGFICAAQDVVKHLVFIVLVWQILTIHAEAQSKPCQQRYAHTSVRAVCAQGETRECVESREMKRYTAVQRFRRRVKRNPLACRAAGYAVTKGHL